MRDCFSIDKIKEYTEDKKVPFSVHWTLTENCNLRCLHCYMAKKPRYVTLNDAEYIVPFIKEKGFLKITLSGGECMLNPDFTSIYKLLKRAGFLISIITNGTVFSAEIKNLFREYPPYEFYISIYGDDESSFQKATNSKVPYTQFLEGLKFLETVQTKKTIQAPITKENIGKLESFKRIAEQYGCEWRFSMFIFNSETGETNPIPERLPAKDIVDYVFTDHQTVKEFRAKKDLLSKPQIPFEDKCISCKNNITINVDNSFSFCGMLESINFPFNQYTIEESYQNTLAFRKEAISIYNKSACGTCDLRNMCSGCPAHCKIETGSFFDCNQYYKDMTEYILKKLNQ